MTDAKLIWLFSAFSASIAANSGLLRVITDDKLKRPNLVAILLNITLSAVGGYFGVRIVGSFPSLFFMLFNIVLFLALLYIVKKRDVKALFLGEKLLSVFQMIDLQICFILNEIYVGANKDLGKPIRRTLRYILSELSNVLGLDSTHHAQLSILVPEDFRFKVIAYSGITGSKLEQMEDVFRFGEKPISLVGHAMNRRIPIIINNLSSNDLSDASYWIKISNEEIKEGSILVYPLIRGIGSNNSDPFALVCITSNKKNAFDVEITKQLLNYFSSKIEILENCFDIVSKSEKG